MSRPKKSTTSGVTNKELRRQTHVMDQPSAITVYQEVGRRLAAARISIQKTQGEMAEEIGVSKSRLSNWETGIRPADPMFLAKLAKRWGFSLDWFYMGEMGGIAVNRLRPLEAAYSELCQEGSSRRGRPFATAGRREATLSLSPAPVADLRESKPSRFRGRR